MEAGRKQLCMSVLLMLALTPAAGSTVGEEVSDEDAADKTLAPYFVAVLGRRDGRGRPGPLEGHKVCLHNKQRHYPRDLYLLDPQLPTKEDQPIKYQLRVPACQVTVHQNEKQIEISKMISKIKEGRAENRIRGS